MTTNDTNNKRPRLVLDTNVLISALVFGGKPRQVVELFVEKVVDVVISHEILKELRRKIKIKFTSFIKPDLSKAQHQPEPSYASKTVFSIIDAPIGAPPLEKNNFRSPLINSGLALILRKSGKDLERLEALLERDAQQVLLGSVHVKVCRDPDDNRIIETALIGNCTYIISGDKDLLILKNYQGIQITTPAEFLELLRGRNLERTAF